MDDCSGILERKFRPNNSPTSGASPTGHQKRPSTAGFRPACLMDILPTNCAVSSAGGVIFCFPQIQKWISSL